MALAWRQDPEKQFRIPGMQWALICRGEEIYEIYDEFMGQYKAEFNLDHILGTNWEEESPTLPGKNLYKTSDSKEPK